MLARNIAWLSLTVPTAGFAHHSFAMFDMQKDVELHVVASSFTWESPHSWLQVKVMNAGAASKEWSIEMGAPNALYKRGLRPTSVKEGDLLTIVVHPLRDGRPGGSLVSVVLADGRTLQIGGGAGSPAAAAK